MEISATPGSPSIKVRLLLLISGKITLGLLLSA